jgi:hypothetical protein
MCQKMQKQPLVWRISIALPDVEKGVRDLTETSAVPAYNPYLDQARIIFNLPTIKPTVVATINLCG